LLSTISVSAVRDGPIFSLSLNGAGELRSISTAESLSQPREGQPH
jgi:hypothetical protein